MTAIRLRLVSPQKANSLEIIHSVFLAATWHHIVITTFGFRQMSVEVQRLAFIYFIAHSLSTKRANFITHSLSIKLASFNCLLNDAKKWSGGRLTLFIWNYKICELTCFLVSVLCVFVVN